MEYVAPVMTPLANGGKQADGGSFQTAPERLHEKRLARP
jgi:hypothetical protein